MRKKILYLASALLFSATSINAQIKVWNFATGTLPGYINVLEDNAKVDAVLYSGKGNVLTTSGAANTLNTSGSFGVATDKVFFVNDTGGDRFRIETTGITCYNNGENLDLFDSYFGANAPWGRFYLNGAGSNTRRYFGFYLAAGESITMYYYTDTNTADVLVVESPKGVLTNIPIPNDVSKTGRVLNLTATEPESGVYKVYSAAKLCVGRIYEGNVTLGTNSFQKESLSSIGVFGNDGKINLSNVKSNTKIEVYSVTGALVKSAEISGDTSLSINSGVYIVKATSEEGSKTTKVIVK